MEDENEENSILLLFQLEQQLKSARDMAPEGSERLSASEMALGALAALVNSLRGDLNSRADGIDKLNATEAAIKEEVDNVGTELIRLAQGGLRPLEVARTDLDELRVCFWHILSGICVISETRHGLG